MDFVGQEKILKELNLILKLSDNPAFSVNLLFRAPSRYGKTDLALRVATHIKSWEYILASEIFSIDTSKRLHIIDEAHEIKEPEFLYPYLDCNKFIFIFCSNEVGELKEPLVNRCIQFIFSPYTLEEIELLVYRMFNGKLNHELIHEISINCQNNPGIAKAICQRLINIFSILGYPNTLDELKYFFVNYLNINDGLNELHTRYLNFLRDCGRASLDLISYGTHIDRATIRRDVEPYLIDRKLIKITSKGREII